MIEALNMLKTVPLKGWDDTRVFTSLRRPCAGIRGSRAYLADPDFAKVPVDGLISACYAKEIAATIDPRRASSSTTFMRVNRTFAAKKRATRRRRRSA